MTDLVISCAEQLSLDWFNAVLIKSGGLLDGAVHSFEAQPLHSDNSNVLRVQLHYEAGSTGDLPARLLLKMCGGSNSTDFGLSEVDYYLRDYVGLTQVPLVKCYSAVYSAEQQGYHLLLADLTETHSNNWDNLSTGNYGLATATALGALHSYWWNVEQLAVSGHSMPDAARLDKYFSHIEPGKLPLLEEIKDEVEPTWPALIKKLFEQSEVSLRQRTSHSPGFTLVHGDVNPGNILSPLDLTGNASTYLIDRQPFDWSLTTWLGVSDLAYMMVLWWETELRRQLELSVLQAYYASLVQNGVRDYPWQQLLEDYKLSVAQCIYVPTEWCVLPEDRQRMKWLWSRQLGRVLRATLDWEDEGQGT